MAAELCVISCGTCPCGRASEIRAGGRCPLVDRQHRRGEYLYIEGGPASSVWFIKRGTVVLTRSMGGEEGEGSARAVRRAGSFVGLEALIQPTYLDTARVASSATLCAASVEVVDAWLGARDAPARVALEQTLRALFTDPPRAAGRDGNAVRRVARWILGEEPGDQVLQRRDVAGLLGMVPETFSRALARLSRDGLVEVTRKTLRVRDHDGLRAASGTSSHGE